MNVVKFYETLAKIIAEKENVQIKVNTKRKECVESGVNEPPKRSVSSH